MPALCDFLEDSASVGDLAVLLAGDCGWTWFELGQEPWPVICAQYRYGTDGCSRMNMKIKTESPRLAVTPGEWYASDRLATTSTGFRQMEDIPNVIGAVKLDCRTVWRVFRRTRG